ncbi:hypothetical protein D3C78_1357450 [compost metagenome]
MHHQHVVLLGQSHHALEEVQFHALGGGVGRETEDHHLRLGDRLADGPLEFVEEVHTRHQRHRTHLGTGNHRPVDMDRVAGVGHQHRVALVEGGQHQVCQAFLRADGDDGFAFRVDVDLVAFLVPVGDSPTQARDATGGGVAVGVFTLGDLHQLLDDVRRGGAIGVAHAQVDDVLATAAGGHLELGSDVEDVRGETIDARKAARRTWVGHGFL